MRGPPWEMFPPCSGAEDPPGPATCTQMSCLCQDVTSPTGRGGAVGRGVRGSNALLFSSSPSLPALDWQLPSHSGPYELRIEVQPKSHHRAHYETEGSRGAVKASAGGHPSVQVPACSPGLLGSVGNFVATASISSFSLFKNKLSSPNWSSEILCVPGEGLVSPHTLRG